LESLLKPLFLAHLGSWALSLIRLEELRKWPRPENYVSAKNYYPGVHVWKGTWLELRRCPGPGGGTVDLYN